MKKAFFWLYQQILRIYVSTFRIKQTKIVHAPGSAKTIGALLHADGIQNALVMTDTFLVELGLLKGMLNSFKAEGISFALYSGVVQNPTVGNVEAAKAVYLENGCQAIVAFGGGSVIDCAKMVGVVALTGKPVKRYDRMIPMIPKMARLYAVPTTAGTGSEVTLSAIITDETAHKKMPITDVKLAPDVAVLDAELMTGLSPAFTSGTGMDALTHAVEAFIGNWKFTVTDEYAIKAVRQIFKFLPRVYDNPQDIDARHEMAIGAMFGGYAFRTAGVGYVHAVAHRLSELYGIPHGMANAMVLPHMLRFSFQSVYKKLADLSKKVGLAKKDMPDKAAATAFIEKIEELNRRFNIPSSIAEIRRGDVPLIARRAIGEANKTYPVPNVMDKKKIARFIGSLLPDRTCADSAATDIGLLNERIAATVKSQHTCFERGDTLNFAARKQSLIRLKAAIKDYETKIFEALAADLGKHAFEAYGTEVSIVYAEINHSLKHLKHWMKTRRAPTPLTNIGGVSKIHLQPRGVSLIMSPWNYPFMLALAPVVAALAAGNTVVLKPSSYSPHTSAVMQAMVRDYFDADRFCVFQGNREINTILLEQKFDFIFFTGSVKVGKIVMQQASHTLTPVLLELGGKSPCIVDKTADIKKTAKRIVWGKCVNAGQTCVAPDYLLVHRRVKDALVAEMIKARRKFFGDDMLASPDFGTIIRPQAFERLEGLMKGQTLLDGGKTDKKKRRMELALLDNPKLSSPVMQQEIFGPILPIIPFDTEEEAISVVRQYEKPLALYVFTADRALERRIITTLRYGGGCVNDTLMHIANSHLPFGGVGESGMGAYHARHGFEAFSHTKSVVRQNFLFDVPIRYAPYNRKLGLLKMIIK